MLLLFRYRSIEYNNGTGNASPLPMTTVHIYRSYTEELIENLSGSHS